MLVDELESSKAATSVRMLVKEQTSCNETDVYQPCSQVIFGTASEVGCLLVHVAFNARGQACSQ